MSGSYEIHREFTRGYVAAINVDPRQLSESDHWLAGWDAGYAARKQKNEALDAYLVSIGMKPQNQIRLCDQE